MKIHPSPTDAIEQLFWQQTASGFSKTISEKDDRLRRRRRPPGFSILLWFDIDPDLIRSDPIRSFLTLRPFSYNLEQNNPLYIQSFTEAEDALKLHHIVHCSLDVIDERGSSSIYLSEMKFTLIDCCYWIPIFFVVANSEQSEQVRNDNERGISRSAIPSTQLQSVSKFRFLFFCFFTQHPFSLPKTLLGMVTWLTQKWSSSWSLLIWMSETPMSEVYAFYLPKFGEFFFVFLLFLLCTYSSSGSSMPHTSMPSQTLSMFLAKRSLPEPSPNPLPTLLALTLSTDCFIYMSLFHWNKCLLFSISEMGTLPCDFISYCEYYSIWKWI